MGKKEKLKLKKDVNRSIRLCKKYIQVLKSKHYYRSLRYEYQRLSSLIGYLEEIKQWR